MTQEEQVRLFHHIGFDGFFASWSEGVDLVPLRVIADELGMIFQSVHAPNQWTADLWEPTEHTQEGVDDLLHCLEACARANVPMMVCHPYKGFDKHDPTQFGIDNYRRVVDRARELGVKVAIENVEGIEYLKALLDAFREESHVGFCWDAGHEMCYNCGDDILSMFGDRLFGTHLNDNLGIRNFEGVRSPKDDLHLLPFDGVRDWQKIADRLNAQGFEGPLTFELKYTTKLPDCKHRVYGNLSVLEYYTQAYMRACRVAALFLDGKTK